MPEELSLEEQLVSQAVQLGVSSQLEAAEDIHVDVHTDLLKAAQGKADSVSISGHGMVVQDIRLEELELHTSDIAINLVRSLFGKVEINHPVRAIARVCLTEADLNRAMNSQSMRDRIHPFEFELDREIVRAELQYPITFKLPGHNQIQLELTVLLHEFGQTRSVDLDLAMELRSGSHPILLQSIRSLSGPGLSLELALAIMQRLKALLQQPYLELDGIQLRVQNLEIAAGSITTESEVYVHQIPDL